MKNYFDFKQTGTKLFLVCIAYVICFITYGIYTYNVTMARIAMMQDPEMLSAYGMGYGVGSSLASLWGALVYWLVCLLLGFVFIRLMVDGIAYKGVTLRTDYNFGKYLWLVVSNGFLTIITLGIFYPWYYTRLIRYFSVNALYEGRPFRFKGLGSTLFCILTFVLIIPYAILITLLVVSAGAAAVGSSFFSGFAPVCIVLILLLLMLAYYLMFKWFIDFSHGDKQFKLQAQTAPSVLFLFIQFLLTCFTLGIYYPAAIVLTYRYFVRRTVVFSSEDELTGHFGYDGEPGWDFLYLLGQFLLCLITLGIYSPWMVVRVSRRLAGHTYVELPEGEPVAFVPAE